MRHASPAFSARVSARHDVRDGTQRTAGSFFSTASQLLAPVDQTIDSLEATADFRSGPFQASVSYYGSWFRNNASSLTWANPSMRALEAQAHVPMFGVAPVELGVAGDGGALLARLADEPLYPALFAEAFPDDPAPLSIANLTRAIASFERTIVSGRARVDTGELTDAERRGQALFASARLGCNQCHGGFAFTVATGDDLRFFNTGLTADDPDRGVAAITGDPAQAGWFRPPSLRNVAVTAPYMHDGSVATLEEVIDLYAAGGRGAGVTNPRKSELITGFAITADERPQLRLRQGRARCQPAGASDRALAAGPDQLRLSRPPRRRRRALQPAGADLDGSPARRQEPRLFRCDRYDS